MLNALSGLIGWLGSGCVKKPVVRGKIHCAIVWLKQYFSDGFR